MRCCAPPSKANAGELRASGHSQGRVAAGLAHVALRLCERPNLAFAVALVASAAALASVLIYVLRPLLLRYLLAHPNARSSHTQATPQGAGVGVMHCTARSSVLRRGSCGRRRVGAMALVPALAAVLGLMVLGLADDAHALPVSWRFIGQTLAALVMVSEPAGGLALFAGFLPFIVERALLVLGNGWLRQRRQFSRRARLDHRRASRADDAWRGGACGLRRQFRQASVSWRSSSSAPCSVSPSSTSIRRKCFSATRAACRSGFARLHADLCRQVTICRGFLLALYTVADNDHAGPPASMGAVPLGASLAFLSARGDRRHDAAASDDPDISSRLAARVACDRRGDPQLYHRGHCAARARRGRDRLRSPCFARGAR